MDLDIRSLITRLKNSIRNDGIYATLRKIARYPIRKWQERLFFKKLLSKTSLSEIFSKAYDINLWGNRESVSGHGSSLFYTENLRKHLPDLIRNFSINTIYDAPCGDFNWMQTVILGTKIQYCGADIVPSLIEKLKMKYHAPNIRFYVADITIDEFPNADLWFCRDCLFHLSYKDIYSALRKFLAAEIPYFFTSTHINAADFTNRDICSGDFRLIDLFAAPFHFPNEVKFRINDWVAPHPPREMCLWTKDQVAQAVLKMESDLPKLPGLQS